MAPPRPPPDLHVFKAVARLGSVRLAAMELGVTDGAVSKQVRARQGVADPASGTRLLSSY